MHPLLAAASTTVNTCPTATKVTDNSVFGPIAKPIADVLAAVYSVIPNYGVAIIALSVVWMIIIAPLTLKSTRSMLAMQKLQPELKKLQAEHKNDRQAFATAQMDLFKEHNVSPFGSCLPTLLPLPVFFALFRVIDGLSHTVKLGTNKLVCAEPNFLSPHTQMYKSIHGAGGHLDAFGLDLSKNALSGHSSFVTALPYFVLLLIMIGTQYLQTAQMMSRNKAAADNPQMKMMKYLPIVFGVILIRFPAGVILYYAMSNVCRVIQQTAMYRFDPKVKALAVQDIREVEDEIQEINTGKRPTKPVVDPPTASRRRFRDLLADAADQQQSRKAADKPVPPKPSGKSNPKSGASQAGRNTRPPARKPDSTSPPPSSGKASLAKPPPSAKKPTGSPSPRGQGSAGNAPAGTRNGAKTNPPKANGAKANPARTNPAKANPAKTNGAATNGAANGTNGNQDRTDQAPEPADNDKTVTGNQNGGGPRPGGPRTGATPGRPQARGGKKRRGR